MGDSNSNTGAWIGAAAEVGSSALNALSASALNRRSEKYNWEMWNVQRQAQIQDWWRTQAYNSPANQMKLYKEAGLNPNLIYGSQGGFQGAGLQSPPSGQSLNLKQPDLSGAGRAVGTYFNVQMQQAMVANQVKTNDLLEAQINKTSAETDAIRLGMGKTGAEITGLGLANALSEKINDLKVQFEKGAVSKQNEETQSIITSRYWNVIQSATSISEAATRMVKNMAETGLLGKQAQKTSAETLLLGLKGQLDQLDIDYEKKFNAKMPQQNAMINIMSQIYETIKAHYNEKKNEPVDKTTKHQEEFYKQHGYYDLPKADTIPIGPIQRFKQ